ncbi:MAG TPA: sensor histidine kinase [Rubrobacter sp.]|nr:sensor histidine kinase [Rubrobacter sp.]
MAGEPRKEKPKSDEYGTPRGAAERGNLERERERLLGRGEFVRQLLAICPNGSVNVFDRDLRYLLAEGRGLKEEGLTPEMLVGKTIEELFPKESADFVRPFYQRAFAGENVEFELALGDRTYGIFAAPLREENGEVRTIIAVAQDVTERKRVQAERERLVAREQKARATEEERKRISRELHDRVAQSMSVVHQSLELYEALRRSDPERARAKMDLAKETTLEAVRLTRDLSSELRGSEVQEEGLSAALSGLLEAYVPPRLECDLSVEGDESLIPSHVREQLFVILREGVRNVVEHSEASRVDVEVRVSSEEVAGRVRDDGRGFAVEGVYHVGGMRSMKERAELVGGTFEASSVPGVGTAIGVSIPLKWGRGSGA